MPEHFEGDWISANNRYTALNDSIFYARGEDIYLDIEGPTGERVATYWLAGRVPRVTEASTVCPLRRISVRGTMKAKTVK